MNCLTREQVRRLDQLAIEDYGIPGVVLMENAGRGVVEVMSALGVDGPVIILAGTGNNAGDGLVIARHLDLLGYQSVVVTCTDPSQWQGDTATNYRIAQASQLDVRWLQDLNDAELETMLETAAWIVDAILGTGAVGAPRAPYDQLIRLANDSTARRLAVDIPSGLDCDSGLVADPTFKADHTCTFVAAKPGLISASAAPYVGELHIVDIGAPKTLIDSLCGEEAK